MPPCTPFSSFRQVLELGHPFVPTHANAVEGLHLPGARPIHPLVAQEENLEANKALGNAAAGIDGGENPRNHANEEEGAGAGHIPQAPEQQAPIVANPLQNRNDNANAPGIEAVIQEKISALVAAVRRLFPVMIVERWLRRLIRDH